ncbi:hypothetical protein JL721_12813 [Aureococcus anophagefferens]|nr:hypothetical protein JL721_12813 [Aureococcus anophagefferens]
MRAASRQGTMPCTIVIDDDDGQPRAGHVALARVRTAARPAAWRRGVEAVFEERLNDADHFDAYMDYSVAFTRRRRARARRAVEADADSVSFLPYVEDGRVVYEYLAAHNATYYVCAPPAPPARRAASIAPREHRRSSSYVMDPGGYQGSKESEIPNFKAHISAAAGIQLDLTGTYSLSTCSDDDWDWDDVDEYHFACERVPSGDVTPLQRANGRSSVLSAAPSALPSASRRSGGVSAAGGGARNSFGDDFAAAGFAWTPWLCEADSDGDGQSNGFELGDPCCCWEAEAAWALQQAPYFPPVTRRRAASARTQAQTRRLRGAGVSLPGDASSTSPANDDEDGACDCAA